MNQFNQLTLIVQPEGKCIRWKENHSPRLPGWHRRRHEVHFLQTGENPSPDIQAREGVNNNAKGASLATVVRIYQLKERKAFDSTDYPSLFASDTQAIKADLVAEKDIRLRPGESVTLDMPMEESAQVVAVAGMFMAPDQVNDTAYYPDP